jgi:hypothetical protein
MHLHVAGGTHRGGSSHHINLFTRAALEEMLKLAGFETLEYSTLSTYINFVRAFDTKTLLLRRMVFNLLRSADLASGHARPGLGDFEDACPFLRWRGTSHRTSAFPIAGVGSVELISAECARQYQGNLRSPDVTTHLLRSATSESDAC